jgi:hypothetical protein
MVNPNSDDVQKEWVIIREDKPDLIQDLSDMLSDKDIPFQIALAPGCGNKSCAIKYILLVSRENVQAGVRSIEEYFMKLHPEIIESQERIKEGKCPACGNNVGPDAKECDDCGLQLIIEI